MSLPALKLRAWARRQKIPELEKLSDEEIDKQLLAWRFKTWDDYYKPFLASFEKYLQTLSKLYPTDCLVAAIDLDVEKDEDREEDDDDLYNLYAIDIAANGHRTKFGIWDKSKVKHLTSVTKYYRASKIALPAKAGRFMRLSLCKNKKLIIGCIGVHFRSEDGGHAAVFIYNESKDVFYYYDPHGVKRSDAMAKVVETHIARYMFGADFVDLSHWSEGIQQEEAVKKITGQNGFCYAWSALIVETCLSLGARYLTLRKIVATLGDEPPASLAVKLLRFVRHVIDTPDVSRLRLGYKGPVRVSLKTSSAGVHVQEYDTLEEGMRALTKTERKSGDIFVGVRPDGHEMYYSTETVDDDFLSRYHRGVLDPEYYQRKVVLIRTSTGELWLARNLSTEEGVKKILQNNPPEVIRGDLKQVLSTFFGISDGPDEDGRVFAGGMEYKVEEEDPDFIFDWTQGRLTVEQYRTVALVQDYSLYSVQLVGPIPPPPPIPAAPPLDDDDESIATIPYDMEDSDEEQSFGSDNASVTTWPYDMGYESDITDDMEEDIEEAEEDDNLPSSFYPTPEGTPERMPSPSI